MTKEGDTRERLVRALLTYPEESGTFNPHFHRQQMMQRLGFSEGQFNIAQNQLGDRYCHYIDQQGGDARYEICVSECMAFRDQFDQEALQARRHRQLVGLAILAAVLGAVVAVALNVWLQAG